MDEVLCDEPDHFAPRVTGRVDAEDLIEPKARRRQVPKTNQNVNCTYNSKRSPLWICEFFSCQRWFGAAEEDRGSMLDGVADPAVNARVKERHLFECVGVAAVRSAAIIRF